ncbi:MAG TPA: 7-cyano-7-deazaguanine synthase QueC [Vicinamibacterales bacterium]|nr:7-cyano-7-deazaguanine synthase QueC [Vicinamibacterales bacterium]
MASDAGARPGVVVLLSGGLDSYTAAAMLQRDGYDLFALTVRYGQRHAREIEAARRIAQSLGVRRHLEVGVDLGAIGGSALTGGEAVPKDRVIDASGIPVTYVPARNTVMLSLALGWAETLGVTELAIGANAVDYSGYPDCRPDYLVAFERLATLATREGVHGARYRIHAPLLRMTKGEIVKTGLALGLDYGLTHSCYDPLPSGLPCRRCDSCILRARGFAEAGAVDPLLVAV